MKRLLVMAALTTLLSGPVAAQQETPDEIAREGLEKLMRAMELFIGTIPLYEAPEILPNGDIIIRRVPRGDAPQWKREPEDGGQEPPPDDRA
ncbi:MAG: hypothetical protein NXI16_05870 [Alphaproteobacteria bacterium]|nr:hypothetical protein [Alphaproteobacteria bacterium]